MSDVVAKREFVYIWEYEVPEAQRETFERIYGPAGDWVELFSKADGYIRTDLHRDIDTPAHYVTVDHWTTRKAHDDFRIRFKAEFEALDARCEELTTWEKHLGDFDLVVT